jgi:MFS family permease
MEARANGEATVTEKKPNVSTQRPIFILLGLNLLTLIASNMTTPTLYLYALELGASVAYVGIIASVTSVARLVSRIPIGLVSDRFGRRQIMRIGALGIAASLMLLYLADKPLNVLLGSIINALGLTAIFTIGLTMASEIQSSRKATGVSFFALASSLAMVIAPGTCSLLLLVLRIRTTYLIGALIGLGGILCSIPLAALPSLRKAFDIRGSLKSLLKDKRVQFVATMEAFFSLAFNSIFVFFPLYLSEEFQLTSAEISFLLTMYSLAMLTVRLPLPRILRRIEEKTIICLGFVDFALVLMILPFSNTFVHFSALMLAAGTAHGLLFPSMALVVSRSSRLDLGLANSIYLGAGDVVSIVAPIGIALLIEASGYGSFYMLVSAVIWIGFVYALRERKNSGQSAATSA